MTQRVKEIKLTPPFRKSADKLLKKNPKLKRRIAAKLNILINHPDSPGLHREPIGYTSIDNLYSLRVNKSIRILEHESRLPTAFAMYVDHHDEAYAWARQHRSANTDAVDEAGETWRGFLPGEAEEPQLDSTESTHQPAPTFSSRELLKSLGPADPGEEDLSRIPVEELFQLGLTLEDAERIRQAPYSALFNGYVDDLADDILDLYDEYTPIAVEASSAPLPIPLDPAEDDIAITSGAQFLQMVEVGLDRYLTTITPEQQTLAHIEQQRLLVIQGSGGSGKTTVAIHRLRYLADRIATQPQLLASGERRVIYLCFNRTLAEVASQMTDTVYSTQVPENVAVVNLHLWAMKYLEQRGVLRSRGGGEAMYRRVRHDLEGSLANCMSGNVDNGRLTARFVAEEIKYVIIGRGIGRIEEYLNVERTGRKTGLRESERRMVWRLYEQILADRQLDNAVDIEMLPAMALWEIADDPTFLRYDAVIVDEAQDFTPIALRLAMRLAGNQPTRVTIFGDAAQSIYPSGFSWSLPELSPRSRELYRLTKNHRNTAQIYELADALLGHGVGPEEPEDYVTADRPTSTGPVPVLVTCLDRRTELSEVTARIRKQLDDGVFPQTIGVLCGTRKDKEEMGLALDVAGIPAEVQGKSGQNSIHITQPSVKVLTMHSAKGLDFPHVYLVGLTNNGLPGARHDFPGADPYSYGLEQQRRLLYTSMIRAGQTLVMTTVAGDEHVLLADMPSGLYRDERIAAE